MECILWCVCSRSPSDDFCGGVSSFLHHVAVVLLGHVVQLRGGREGRGGEGGKGGEGRGGEGTEPDTELQ